MTQTRILLVVRLLGGGATVNDIDLVVAQFLEWGQKRSPQLSATDIEVALLGVPHTPVPLRKGWQGVYAFVLGTVWLKVGKVGPNSNARWVSQHYSPTRSLSNLPWSLMRYTHLSSFNHPRLPANLRTELRAVPPNAFGDWIKKHAARVNFTIRADLGSVALDRLERIAHDVLKPVFEGRWDAAPTP